MFLWKFLSGPTLLFHLYSWVFVGNSCYKAAMSTTCSATTAVHNHGLERREMQKAKNCKTNLKPDFFHHKKPPLLSVTAESPISNQTLNLELCPQITLHTKQHSLNPQVLPNSCREAGNNVQNADHTLFFTSISRIPIKCVWLRGNKMKHLSNFFGKLIFLLVTQGATLEHKLCTASDASRRHHC